MKATIVKATKVPNRETWRVQFKHWSPDPVTKKLKWLNVNLGPDEQIAHAIAAILTTLSNESIFHNRAARVPAIKLREFGYGPAAQRALAEWFRDDADAATLASIFDGSIGLTEADIVEVRKHVEEDNAARESDYDTDEEGNLVALPAGPSEISADAVEQILQRFAPSKMRMLQDHIAALELKLQSASARIRRVEDLEAEVSHLNKMLNQSVTDTVGVAFDKWFAKYKVSKAQRTEGEAVLESFIDSLPLKRDTLLRDTLRHHVKEWIDNLKGRSDKRKAEITSTTRRHKYSFLRTFFAACVETYSKQHYISPLTTPMKLESDADDESGPSAKIRRFTDLKTFLDALAPDPYWHIFATFSCLAGPRLGEQFKMTLDDVLIDENRVVIYATKTKRERRVPIEKSILKPLLVAHIARRREQQKTGTSEAEKSQLLFPSNVPDGTISRTLAAAGRWSGTKAFNVAWKRARKTLKTSDAEYWSYGPREWRRTFGTALANCGFNALQISRAMGNSVDVAQEHYVDDALDVGAKRWPLEYLDV